MNKLTVRNLLFAILAVLGLWLVMMVGALTAGAVLGYLSVPAPPKPVQIIKYVDHPRAAASTAAPAPSPS